MPRRITSVRERLERRREITADGCWNWLGSRTPQGYGLIRDESKRLSYTHRQSYMTYVGPIPDGLVIDHLCRNRACFNPTHLEPVTNRENARRGLTGHHMKKKAITT